jgi:hypothetical protein
MTGHSRFNFNCWSKKKTTIASNKITRALKQERVGSIKIAKILRQTKPTSIEMVISLRQDTAASISTARAKKKNRRQSHQI